MLSIKVFYGINILGFIVRNILEIFSNMEILLDVFLRSEFNIQNVLYENKDMHKSAWEDKNNNY